MECAQCGTATALPRFECCLDYYCAKCSQLCIECQAPTCPQCHVKPVQVCSVKDDTCRNYLRHLCVKCARHPTCDCLVQHNSIKSLNCVQCHRPNHTAEFDLNIHCFCLFFQCEACGQYGEIDESDVDYCTCCRCIYCAKCARWIRFSFKDAVVPGVIRRARVAQFCFEDGSAQFAYDLDRMFAEQVFVDCSELAPYLK